MAAEPLRIIVFGAHPDDCDLKAGGVAALWTRLGHQVQFVSLTNGDAAHPTMAGAPLARRRRAEARASGTVLGVESIVLDNPEGELLPTLENRREIIRLMRDHRPNLVLGPRPNNYHPDHRATAILVQDATYMATMPNVVAFTTHLATSPVIMYTSDHFQNPAPFTPDIAIDIDGAVVQKLEALACHVSQYFEWLPANAGIIEDVPTSDSERRAWLGERLHRLFQREAERARAPLIERYSAERGGRVRCAESFQLCEYGVPLTPPVAADLFPF